MQQDLNGKNKHESNANNDEQLKTPAHDELMLLLNKVQKKLVGKIYSENEVLVKKFDNSVIEFNLKFEVPLYQDKQVSAYKTTEYLIGVADALIFIWTVREASKENIESGYYKKGELVKSFEGKHVLEIKPIIKSVGETLRQINRYCDGGILSDSSYGSSVSAKTNLSPIIITMEENKDHREFFESNGVDYFSKKDLEALL